jgi:choline-sulfatase
MAAYVSDQIDAAVAVLKKLGIYDEALIILASDHGDFAGEHGAVEKWDTLFYDCLIHIPLLLKLPHFRMAGERRSTLCEIIDLAPTICQIAGMPVSDYFHGKSLMDAVADPSFVHREEVFCEGGVEPQALARSLHYDTPEHRKRHPNYLWKQKIMVDFPYSMIRAKMIRTREWKLTFRVDGEIELYNLIQDPGEFENLSGRPEAASISQDLIRRLLQWSIRTEPDTPRIEVMYS